MGLTPPNNQPTLMGPGPPKHFTNALTFYSSLSPSIFEAISSPCLPPKRTVLLFNSHLIPGSGISSNYPAITMCLITLLARFQRFERVILIINLLSLYYFSCCGQVVDRKIRIC